MCLLFFLAHVLNVQIVQIFSDCLCASATKFQIRRCPFAPTPRKFSIYALLSNLFLQSFVFFQYREANVIILWTKMVRNKFSNRNFRSNYYINSTFDSNLTLLRNLTCSKLSIQNLIFWINFLTGTWFFALFLNFEVRKKITFNGVSSNKFSLVKLSFLFMICLLKKVFIKNLTPYKGFFLNSDMFKQIYLKM